MRAAITRCIAKARSTTAPAAAEVIGRLSAECAFCTTALPLSEGHCQGHMATVVCRRWPIYPAFDVA